MAKNVPSELETPFGRWVAYVFSHRVKDPPWWWSARRPHWEELENPATTVDYLTQLFEEPAKLLQRFSREQVGQGLWFLFDFSCSSHFQPLLLPLLPAKRKLGCIRALGGLYEPLFAPACEADPWGGHPLNLACYMLWDLVPLSPGSLDAQPELAAACLDAMGKGLASAHPCCQVSGLHGLGHWHHATPREVEARIDAFLAEPRARAPKVLEYARRARSGYVQ